MPIAHHGTFGAVIYFKMGSYSIGLSSGSARLSSGVAGLCRAQAPPSGCGFGLRWSSTEEAALLLLGGAGWAPPGSSVGHRFFPDTLRLGSAQALLGSGSGFGLCWARAWGSGSGFGLGVRARVRALSGSSNKGPLQKSFFGQLTEIFRKKRDHLRPDLQCHQLGFYGNNAEKKRMAQGGSRGGSGRIRR